MVSFAEDIAPLFRPNDVGCMRPRGVLLDNYAYMSNPDGDADFKNYANARLVLAHLEGSLRPRMPLGGPFWTADQIDLFRQWIDIGCSP